MTFIPLGTMIDLGSPSAIDSLKKGAGLGKLGPPLYPQCSLKATRNKLPATGGAVSPEEGRDESSAEHKENVDTDDEVAELIAKSPVAMTFVAGKLKSRGDGKQLEIALRDYELVQPSQAGMSNTSSFERDEKQIILENPRLRLSLSFRDTSGARKVLEFFRPQRKAGFSTKDSTFRTARKRRSEELSVSGNSSMDCCLHNLPRLEGAVKQSEASQLNPPTLLQRGRGFAPGALQETEKSIFRSCASEKFAMLNRQSATSAKRANSQVVPGFSNLGNTCFMNSVLRALVVPPELTLSLLHFAKKYGKLRRDWRPDTQQVQSSRNLTLINDFSEGCPELPGCPLTNSYVELIYRVLLKNDSIVSPDQFQKQVQSNLPMFRGSMQHDAHEFLCMFVEACDEEMRSGTSADLVRVSEREQAVDNVEPKVEENPDHGSGRSYLYKGRRGANEMDSETPIEACLECKFIQETRCVSCGLTRRRKEAQRCISLDFPPDVIEKSPDGKKGDTERSAGQPLNKLSLERLLTLFFSPTELEYFCENCDGTAITMSYSIDRKPFVLFLHIKRFLPDLTGCRLEKLRTPVDIPEYLDLDSCFSSSDSAAAQETEETHNKEIKKSLGGADVSPDSTGKQHEKPSSGEDASESRSPPDRTKITYRLKAFVAHLGQGTDSGHYVCYSRNWGKSRSGWTKWDDSNKADLGLERPEAIFRDSYIIVYERERPPGHNYVQFSPSALSRDRD